MVMLLYSIYDFVAKEYGPVFEAKNSNVAARKYIDVMSQRSFIGSRDDYGLFLLGEVSHESGELRLNDNAKRQPIQIPVQFKDNPDQDLKLPGMEVKNAKTV